jgi:hypothetical protein
MSWANALEKWPLLILMLIFKPPENELNRELVYSSERTQIH